MTPGRPLSVVLHDGRINQSSPEVLIRLGLTGWARLPDGTIHLQADPAGTRPLSWRFLSGTLHLACYPGDLVGLEPSPELDLEVLSGLASFRFPDDGASPFAGIRRVVAGSQTRISPAGDGVESRWWTLPAEPTHSSDLGALWPALVSECRRIMAGRRVAILLSGGLDSSTVAAAAAQAARDEGWPPPLLASLVYPGLPCDESPWQEAVARHVGLERVTVNPIGSAVWPAARAAIRRQLAPLIDTQAGAMERLVQLSRAEGCEVMLTGFGGDVLFRGLGIEVSLARKGRLFAIHRHFSGLSQAMPVSLARLWYGSVLRPFITGTRTPGLARDEVERAGSSVRSLVTRAISEPAFGWIMEGVEQGGGAPPPTLESPYYGPGFLAAFASVTEKDFLRSRSHKGILRELARPHLPTMVVDRLRKSNFLEYHRTWLVRERGAMAARYRELRPAAPLEMALPPDIDGALEATTGPRGFSRSWMALSVLEVLNAARCTG